MTVNVKFVGSFRGVSGKSKIVFTFAKPISMKVLVNTVVKRLPKLKSSLIDLMSGEPRSNMLVLVNGQEIGVLNGINTKIKDGDEIVFVPVMHGG